MEKRDINTSKRMKLNSETHCFFKLKDHKENFMNNSAVCHKSWKKRTWSNNQKHT